jgi:hypothetical protein
VEEPNRLHSAGDSVRIPPSERLLALRCRYIFNCIVCRYGAATFPEPQNTSPKSFLEVTRLCGIPGTLTGVRTAAERGANQGVDEEESTVQMAEVVHVLRREELQDVFMFPNNSMARTSMQKARVSTACTASATPWTCAIWLRGWNFASGSGIVTGSSLHPVQNPHVSNENHHTSMASKCPTTFQCQCVVCSSG